MQDCFWDKISGIQKYKNGSQEAVSKLLEALAYDEHMVGWRSFGVRKLALFMQSLEQWIFGRSSRAAASCLQRSRIRDER
jgi:hypothetical protein